MWVADATALERVEPLWSVLLAAVRESGATVLDQCVHQFQPAGFTGVVLLAQSHVSLHTWTDQRLLLLDIQTCGPIDADLILQRLATYLRPLRLERRQWERGAAASEAAS